METLLAMAATIGGWCAIGVGCFYLGCWLGGKRWTR